MLNLLEAAHKHIYALGMNHQTANVASREKISFSPEECLKVLPILQQELQVEEMAILSTCNRTEFYFVGEEKPDLLAWLAEYKALSPEELENHFFTREDRAAVRHIFRVASGLDSLILGEPQILGQIKQAYHVAKEAHTVHSSLDRLMQQAFSIAKRVRHQTTIGENPVSVAYAGVKLTEQFFNDHPQRCALIVGAGDTAKLTAKYLRDYQIGRLIIANRTLSNAQKLAEEVGGYAITLEQISSHLHEADMVFATARSEVPLIHFEQVEKALQQRRYLQVYVDLAMPRNIEANIEELDSAFLYSIDDLDQIIDKNIQARRKAADKAEIMVNLHSDDFLGWFLSKPQQQIIRNMREEADEIRQNLLSEAYRRLALGEEPSKVLEQFSIKLSNKLLHNPSKLIQIIPPDHKDWLGIIADTFKK